MRLSSPNGNKFAPLRISQSRLLPYFRDYGRHAPYSLIAMKQLLLLFLICLPLVFTFESCKSSKKGDKAEIKKWKQKAKYYKKNPLALKAKEEACQNEIAELTKKNTELNKRIQDLDKQLKECEEKYARLQRERDARYDSLVYEFKKLQAALEATKTATVTTTDNSKPVQPQRDNAPVEQGILYRVQIGAYQKFKIDDKMANTESNFSGETMDNLNKYLIGRFKSYDLAQAFRRDIIKLGIRDAFVVAYQDGIRISVGEAQKKQR
jgi:hypothetical protein